MYSLMFCVRNSLSFTSPLSLKISFEVRSHPFSLSSILGNHNNTTLITLSNHQWHLLAHDDTLGLPPAVGPHNTGVAAIARVPPAIPLKFNLLWGKIWKTVSSNKLRFMLILDVLYVTHRWKWPSSPRPPWPRCRASLSCWAPRAGRTRARPWRSGSHCSCQRRRPACKHRPGCGRLEKSLCYIIIVDFGILTIVKLFWEFSDNFSSHAALSWCVKEGFK